MKIHFIYPLLLLIFFGCQPQKDSSKPNIILIFTDDQGYQDVGCFGSPDISTPNIDRMAEEGMRFTNFYVADPVCSPSRAALMTGCYPGKVGVTRVLFPNRGTGGLEPENITIAEVLKTAGYATKAVGKWHLGDDVKYLPTNQGFDSYFGIPYSNDMTPSKTMSYARDCNFRAGFSKEKLDSIFKNAKGVKPNPLKNKVPLMRDTVCIELPADQSTITKRYTDESLKFVSECTNNNQPFFLYLAHTMPHVPLFASNEFKGKSKGGDYGDVIEEIDFNIGRILKLLDDLKITKKTLVIFTSDNGPWLVKGDQAGSAFPLFEGKMTFFEGGLRVPAVMRWPEKIPASTVCDELTLTMDLLPTIASITGAKMPVGVELDGKNVINLLLAKEGATTPHEYFFYRNKAVRHGDWKYHESMVYKLKKTKRDYNGPALYNLKEDIGETNNVIEKYPEVASHLKAKLKEHNKQLGIEKL